MAMRLPASEAKGRFKKSLSMSGEVGSLAGDRVVSHERSRPADLPRRQDLRSRHARSYPSHYRGCCSRCALLAYVHRCREFVTTRDLNEIVLMGHGRVGLARDVCKGKLVIRVDSTDNNNESGQWVGWSKPIPGGRAGFPFRGSPRRFPGLARWSMVDRVFDGLESFPQALAYLAEGHHFSKIARRIA